MDATPVNATTSALPNTSTDPQGTIAQCQQTVSQSLSQAMQQSSSMFSSQATAAANAAASATPGASNPDYQSSLSSWSQKDSGKEASFVADEKSGNKKKVINDLQMGINRGDITQGQASALLTEGPMAGKYNFSSRGHTGTSAGAYAIANETGGALDGGSSDPKKAGREYDAAQVFSLGGLIQTPISAGLNAAAAG